jgi:hypothetical protein
VMFASATVGSSTGASIGWTGGAEPGGACSAWTRETPGRLGVACRAHEELVRGPVRSDCPLEGRPCPCARAGGFIDAPGGIRRFPVRPAALLQFGGSVLDESGRWWCDRPAVPVPASCPPDRGS